MFKRILAAVDVADPDKGHKILAAAAELAQATGAELRVVTVSAMLEAVRDQAPAGVVAGGEAAARKELEGLTAATSIPAGLSLAVRSGNVATETLAEAEAFGAELIVVGPHKPSLMKMILGSNAATILRNAKVSVFVAR